jgi:hypothetical protein
MRFYGEAKPFLFQLKGTFSLANSLFLLDNPTARMKIEVAKIDQPDPGTGIWVLCLTTVLQL